MQLDLASLSPKERQVPTVWLFKKIYVPTTWVIQVHTHTHTLYSPLIHPHGPNLDFLPVNSHIYHSETLKSPFKHFYYHNAIHHMDIEKYSDHNTLFTKSLFLSQNFPCCKVALWWWKLRGSMPGKPFLVWNPNATNMKFGSFFPFLSVFLLWRQHYKIITLNDNKELTH